MKTRKRIGRCAVLGSVILSASLMLGSCGIFFLSPSETGVSATAETLPTATYTYRIDIDRFRDALFTTDSAYRVLVNKTHPVDEGYAPMRLATLDGSLTLREKDVQLEATVALAAEALVRELWAYGWTDICVTSGFRTYAYQRSLFNQYVDNERAAHPGWTYEQAVTEVLTYSARPGTSEHQTGLCMDLIVDGSDPVLDESFANHACYRWLVENAHKFGFILRFPKGMEGITGYSYEPWHYRFVGVEAATEIYQRGLTLEQYLGE